MGKRVRRASDLQIKLRSAAFSRMSISVPRTKLTAKRCMMAALKFYKKKTDERVSHICTES
jgi:hypothetical protein